MHCSPGWQVSRDREKRNVRENVQEGDDNRSGSVVPHMYAGINQHWFFIVFSEIVYPSPLQTELPMDDPRLLTGKYEPLVHMNEILNSEVQQLMKRLAVEPPHRVSTSSLLSGALSKCLCCIRISCVCMRVSVLQVNPRHACQCPTGQLVCVVACMPVSYESVLWSMPVSYRSILIDLCCACMSVSCRSVPYSLSVLCMHASVLQVCVVHPCQCPTGQSHTVCVLTGVWDLTRNLQL